MICPHCKAENDTVAENCFTCGRSLVSLAIGRLIGNRYEILDFLGKGGMGMIYKAHDRALDEIVALKTLRPQIASDADMVRRFVAEIKLARKIRHRNVCAIHDYGEDKRLIYISMEYIDGIDLKKILQEKGGFPQDEAFDVTIQAVKGLEAIHEVGVIHRDLKTHNIMLDSRGVVRLLDFGIAKQQDADTGLTGTGQLVGTPEYMSPEQVRGQTVDFRSDLYSLGIVIFEIFTGSVPFYGDTPIITLFKHLEEAPPLTGPKAAGIPMALVPLLERVLAKDPAERVQTASELIDLLRGARAEARSAGGPTPLPRPQMPPVAATTPAPPKRPTTPTPQPPSPPTPPPRPTTPTPQPPIPPPLEARTVSTPTPAPRAPTPEPRSAPPGTLQPPEPPAPPKRAPTPRIGSLPQVAATPPPSAAPPPAPPPRLTPPPIPVAPPATPPPITHRTDETAALPTPVPAQPRAGVTGVPHGVPAPQPSRLWLIAGGGAAAAVLAGVGLVVLRGEPGSVVPEGPGTSPPASVASGSTPGEEVVTVVRRGASAAPAPVEEVVTIVPGETLPTPAPPPEQPTPASPPTSATPGTTAPPQSQSPSSTSLPVLTLAPSRPTPTPATPTPTPVRTAQSLPPLTLRPAPAPTAAPTPPPTTQPAPAAPTKAFVAGSSRVTSGRDAKGGPKGFDLSGTEVKQAAQFSARLEFETTPPAPRPGDRYTVKIFLDNYGKDRVKLEALSVTTVASSGSSGGPTPPLVRSVDAGERALLHEVSGVWKSGEGSWSLRVEVTNDKNDICRNSLMWK